MEHDHAPAVAAHFLTCSALALAASAAPFVPEGIAVYAGALYLRRFLYSLRQWQAPARVPLHLGRRGYRDATLQRRGAATWPIGTTVADRQQVWLLRSDLAEGCAVISDDAAWRDRVVEQLVFGACLHEMGAVIVQDHETPSLHGRLSRIAEPFGRGAEIAAIDLADPETERLRISEAAIDAALTTLSASPSARALNSALAPVRSLLARRRGEDPLSHFAALTQPDALKALAAGRGDVIGIGLEAADTRSADASALLETSRGLRAIPSDELDTACVALAPFARELSSLPGLSLTTGTDLTDAILTRRITTVRHTSPLSAAIVRASCAEAISALKGQSLEYNLIHFPCDQSTNVAEALKLRADAVERGAVVSIAVPVATSAVELMPIHQKCRIRLSHAHDDEQGSARLQGGLEVFGRALDLDLLDFGERAA